ncbi:PQQ-dependent sugar dehydrogenase [Nocardioides marmoraquaticus]
MRTRLVALAATSALVLTACGSDDPPSADDSPAAPASSATPTEEASEAPAPSARPKVLGEVATELEAPWGIAFLPDGAALVTERDSERVLRVDADGVREVGTVDLAAPKNEAGLLGVAVSPDFASDRRVFLYVSTDTDNRVLRTTLQGGRLGELEPILTGIPLNTFHDGGKLAFGPDEQLYVATGDAGRPELAQDRRSLAGKVLRITQDGEPSRGNPDGTAMWSYGHRNVQGLAWDDEGRLWAPEFGDQTWDELNLVEKGGNYGWPQAEGKGGPEGTTDPRVQWSTDEASPSGAAYVDGRVWVAGLGGERLWRLDVRPGGVRNPTDFLVGRYGRIRAVAAAPDGNLWVATNNTDGRGEPRPRDDRILLVRP